MVPVQGHRNIAEHPNNSNGTASRTINGKNKDRRACAVQDPRMAESSWRTGSCRHQWSVLQLNHDASLPRSSDPREPVQVPAHHVWLHWSVCGALGLAACTLLALGLSANAVAPGRAGVLTSWSTDRFIPSTGCGRDKTVTQSTRGRFETGDVKVVNGPHVPCAACLLVMSSRMPVLVRGCSGRQSDRGQGCATVIDNTNEYNDDIDHNYQT